LSLPLGDVGEEPHQRQHPPGSVRDSDELIVLRVHRHRLSEVRQGSMCLRRSHEARITARPDRARCTGCASTQCCADRLDAPLGTVRGWIRRARHTSHQLWTLGVRVLAALDHLRRYRRLRVIVHYWWRGGGGAPPCNRGVAPKMTGSENRIAHW
jgi:hypothetical protein